MPVPPYGRTALGLLPLLMAGVASAQTVATSPRPASVSVTVYRAPGRSADEPLQLSWLNGYALISETRRIDIPAGEADIRFEGVAGGILPESAIVTGLPDGVVEKNQDAWLLSPASLLDRSLGRRVHLRRTSRETGAVREQDAVVRSGADGAVVIETAEGIEALRCSGIPETLVYDGVPEGLSAKPTLSVRTRSSRAATATVTLSYLSSGFDWQANYIATLAPSGERLELFAWVTLANGDETSFVDAGTQAVAGRVNREGEGSRVEPLALPLNLQCWPAETTSDIPEEELEEGMGYPPPPPPPPPPPMAAPAMMDAAESITVTGARMAKQEELGDLKLYRIPEPVTVAANSQKQVAFLEKDSVRVEALWRSDFHRGIEPVLTLRTTNRKDRGLGDPLPAGSIALFQDYRGKPVLIGESSLDDKAVGEKVEIDFATSTSVHARTEPIMERDREVGTRLVVTNASPRPIRYEAKLPELEAKETRFGGKVQRVDGRWLWAVTIPANGSASIEWRSTAG